MKMVTFGLLPQVDSSLLSKFFSPHDILSVAMSIKRLNFSKNGKLVAQDKFLTLAVSNVFLAPDGFVYLTGNHGVYRKKRANIKDEL